MHYYTLHIGDYASHTAHLDEMEDLAYRRLLDVYYLHEQPLPLEVEQVARMIRMRSQCDCIATVLNEFFTRTENGWISDRADREIAKYHEKLEQASRAGKASAERRKSTSTTSDQQTFNDRSTDVQPTNNQEPITNNHKPKNTATRGSRLPADWVPDADLAQWSKAERPDLDLRKVLLEFRDYWTAQAGQKGVKADWDATWRNWVRRQEAVKQTFAQQSADIIRTTTPSSVVQLESARRVSEELSSGKPPTLEQLAALAKLKAKNG